MLDWALQLLGSEVVDVWADMRRIVAGGDAEDHVKIILRGASGVVGDVEVSSGAALGAPPWHLLGTRGSLIIEGNHAKLKYLAGKGVPKVKASSATPAVGPADINAASLKWLEESPPLRPMPGQFWKSLYRSIRKGAVFPIKLQEVRELMRVIELARKAADRPMPRQRRAVKN
jgi:predicted dehydrogenase